MRTTARSRTLVAVAVAAALVPVVGPASPAQAVTGYHVTAPGGLNARSGPGLQYPVTGRLVDESPLDIACQTTGALVGTGLGAAPTTVWDKLASGWYVSDFYTSTPATESGWTAGIPRCTTPTPVPQPGPTPPRDGCATGTGAGQQGLGRVEHHRAGQHPGTVHRSPDRGSARRRRQGLGQPLPPGSDRCRRPPGPVRRGTPAPSGPTSPPPRGP